MLTNHGDLSFLWVAAAVVMLLVLVGGEMLAASGRRSPSLRSVFLGAVLVSLLVLAGGVAAVRVAPLLEPGRTGPRLNASAVPVGPQPVANATETFDLVRIHEVPLEGWSYAAPGAVDVVPYPTSADRSLELAVDAGAYADACRSFSPITHGMAMMKSIMRLESESADVRIGLRAMAGGAILGETILSGEGAVEYTEGAFKKTTQGALQPTASKWFRVTLAVHLNTGTYDWSIGSLGQDGPSLEVLGAELNQHAVRSTDQFCLSVESDTAGARLLVDDFNSPQ